MGEFHRVILEAPTPLGWVLIVFFCGIIVFALGSTFWKMRPAKDPNAAPKTKGKMRVTNRVQQGIVLLVFSLVINALIGRSILVQQFKTTEYTKKAGWFTHVETDIGPTLGPAVKVIKGEQVNGKITKVNDIDYLYVAVSYNDDGSINADKCFVYHSDNDRSSYVIPFNPTEEDIQNFKKNHSEYHVKGTMSLMLPNEKSKVIDYLVEEHEIPRAQAEQMVGSYKLINEAGADSKAALIFCGCLMAGSIIFIAVALNKSRYY